MADTRCGRRKDCSCCHCCSLLLVFTFSCRWSPWSNNILQVKLKFLTCIASLFHGAPSTSTCAQRFRSLPVFPKKTVFWWSRFHGYSKWIFCCYSCLRAAEAVRTVDFCSFTLVPLQNVGIVTFFKPSFLRRCTGSESPLVPPWTTRTFWIRVHTSKEHRYPPHSLIHV